MEKDDIRNAKVGDMVGINTELFKATALVVKEKMDHKYGRLLECLILTSSEYEYTHINIYVSVLDEYPSSPRWFLIKNKKE
jgi:hypothetical protein